MAFIGNTNITQAFTPAIDYFSGTGSATAFTLSRPVASVAQVQVTIDNVAQNPSSAYTVSGSTITFTSAPLSGTNNIYVYYTSPITQVIAPGQGTVNTTALGNITNIASGNSSLTLQTGSSPTTAVTIDTSQNVTFAKGFTVGSTAFPTFSYYQSSAQTLSGATNTKITFTSNDWDTTSGMFASSRFTPTVAGYYVVDGAITMSSSFCGGETLIYKNGSNFKVGAGVGGGSVGNRFTVSGLVYCNGSTDYIEIYGYVGVGQALSTGSAQTYFQAAMVRSA